MPETDEVLNAIRRLCTEYQQREGEFDSAGMYYNFEIPPRSDSEDRELWLDVAAVLTESSASIESISKLELLRGRIVADRIELLGSLSFKLSNSIGEQIRALRKNIILQPASQAVVNEMEQRRASATSDAAAALMQKNSKPDESLSRIREAVGKLRTVESAFDSFVNRLEGATGSLMSEIVRIRNDLHAVDENISRSGRTSDRYGWWSIILGVLGLVVGVAGIGIGYWLAGR